MIIHNRICLVAQGAKVRSARVDRIFVRADGRCSRGPIDVIIRQSVTGPPSQPVASFRLASEGSDGWGSDSITRVIGAALRPELDAGRAGYEPHGDGHSVPGTYVHAPAPYAGISPVTGVVRGPSCAQRTLV